MATKKVNESAIKEADILLSAFVQNSKPLAEALMEFSYKNKEVMEVFHANEKKVMDKYKPAIEKEIKALHDKSTAQVQLVKISSADLQAAGVPSFMLPLLETMFEIK